MAKAEFARKRMMERHVQGGVVSLRSGGLPEEVMTWELVQLLSSLQSGPLSSLIIASHSKGLEGGTTNQPASGADLELAIEVAPGQWIDLLLQAKRLYRDSSKYESWKQMQVQALQNWATANGRTPGMLLYNCGVAPFLSGTYVVQGGCSTGHVEMSNLAHPPRPFPSPCAPLGVTLVVLPSFSGALPPGLHGDGLTAKAVNEYASPWECVLCTHWPALSRSHANGLSPAPVSDSMPGWALEITELRAEPKEDRHVADLVDLARPAGGPALSVILPWNDAQVPQPGPD